MIVHRDPIPPIWRPVARYRYWRKRRVLAAQPLEDFSSYRMPIIKQRYSAPPIQEIVSAQDMSESFEHAKQADNVIAWNVVHQRTRWYDRLRMIRRDFLKLCTAAASALVVTPQMRPKYEISDTPLEIVLVSITARLIAKGTSHPDDPADKLIEFEAFQTGKVHWVIVNHLFTATSRSTP